MVTINEKVSLNFGVSAGSFYLSDILVISVENWVSETKLSSENK